MKYYKHEANLEEMIDTSQQVLALVHGDASEYADMIRYVIWSIHAGKTGNSGLPTATIRWQLARVDGA